VEGFMFQICRLSVSTGWRSSAELSDDRKIDRKAGL
jgi:hypothetical protein